MGKAGYIENNFNSVLSLETSIDGEKETGLEYELLVEKNGYFDTAEINFLRERYLEQKNERILLMEEYDRLTSHADYLDYAVAAGCGVLCGMLDAFVVGEIDLTKANEWGSEQVNKFVRTTAHLVTKKDYPADKAGLEKAIRELEKRFPIPADLATAQFGGGRQHHLRDFSHHPNLLGLLFSVLTQFTGKVYGTNTLGNFLIVDVTDTELIGKSFAEKMLLGVVHWFFHMVSDIAGSSAYAGEGTGLPGAIVSLAKMASVLPIFQDENGNNELSLIVSKAFNGTLFMKRDAYGNIIKESVVRMDLRTELGALKQQAGVVLLNEVLVRSFYFVSRFVKEVQEKQVDCISDLQNIDWKKCAPAKNRTIVRMMSIATTTFTVVDLADALIRAAYKSGGDVGTFAGEMLLRVNFVGIGRTVIAIGTDISMGFKKSKVAGKIEEAFREELQRYNVLLGAERVHLEKIVCWDLSGKLDRLQTVIAAQSDKKELESATDEYMKEHHLDKQFDDFDSFSDFMMNSNEDLII